MSASDVALDLLTASLVVVTAVLAWFTKSLRDVADRERRDAIRPQVVFRPEGPEGPMEVVNAGRGAAFRLHYVVTVGTRSPSSPDILSGDEFEAWWVHVLLPGERRTVDLAARFDASDYHVTGQCFDADGNKILFEETVERRWSIE